MEVAGFYEALTLLYHATWLHIPRNSHPSTKRREKLKSHELRLICLSSAGVFRKVTGLTVVTESGCLEFFFMIFLRYTKMVAQFFKRPHFCFLPLLRLFIIGTLFTVHTV
jgi:hypothetical protein